MKRVLRWVCCAALCVLALSEAGWANDKKEGQTFTQKQPENYYLAGAVPEVNGKVVFRRELELPGWSQDQIFDKVKEWLVRSEQQDQDIILNRNIVREDKAKGEIYVQNQEYLVFVDRGLSLDRADFSFLQRYICSPGKCVLEVSRLKYVYDNETHMAEGWISDDYALDKNKTKVYPGVRRQRIKTVDRVDELFAGLTGSFMVLQLAQTPVQAGMTGAPSVMFPASQTAPVLPLLRQRFPLLLRLKGLSQPLRQSFRPLFPRKRGIGWPKRRCLCPKHRRNRPASLTPKPVKGRHYPVISVLPRSRFPAISSRC